LIYNFPISEIFLLGNSSCMATVEGINQVCVLDTIGNTIKVGNPEQNKFQW